MKKYVVPLFLAACLLLTACGPKAPDMAEPSDPPSAAPSAAPETTDVPTPEPTAEPTPEPTAAPRFTAGEETVYVLCEGRSGGAKALSRWLRSAGKDTAETFIPDGWIRRCIRSRLQSVIPKRSPRLRTRRAVCASRRIRSFWKAAFSPLGSRRLRPRPDTLPRFMPEMRPSSLPRLPRRGRRAADEKERRFRSRHHDALSARYELVSTIYSVI